MNTNPQKIDTNPQTSAVKPKPMRTRPAQTVAVAAADPRITVVVPCLNEEATITGVVQEIFAWANTAREHIEVIVADNGSTDRSKQLASKPAQP